MDQLPGEDTTMTTAHKARYCACGARLARDNTGSRCGSCVAACRDRLAAPPDFPADFWDEVVLREALLGRHMGRVIRAWRTHPHHGRQPFSQDQVAAWMGITQAQLSRIENGPPMVHLDRLIQWARLLRIPPQRLWFTLPDGSPEEGKEDERVKRRDFLAATGMTMIGGLLPQQAQGRRAVTHQEAAEWLAWQLWQKRATYLDSSQVPASLARKLDVHPHVLHDQDGSYRFIEPSLVDALVAQRIFGDIASGNTQLLATAQTSHATDLTLSNLAAYDEAARRGLSRWMSHGASAVLRVNAAGILSKVGTPEVGDTVISTIRGDHDVRHLYVTAVASRVLTMPWERAARFAASVDQNATQPSDSPIGPCGTWAGERLCAELMNPRDAAARWCSAVILSRIPQPSDTARAALGAAAQIEPCRENLRAYAAVLAGATPIT